MLANDTKHFEDILAKIAADAELKKVKQFSKGKELAKQLEELWRLEKPKLFQEAQKGLTGDIGPCMGTFDFSTLLCPSKRDIINNLPDELKGIHNRHNLLVIPRNTDPNREIDNFLSTWYSDWSFKITYTRAAETLVEKRTAEPNDSSEEPATKKQCVESDSLNAKEEAKEEASPSSDTCAPPPLVRQATVRGALPPPLVRQETVRSSS